MNKKIEIMKPAPEYIDLLNKVLDANQKILEQNDLIIKALMMPPIIYKTEEAKDVET